MSKSYIVKRDKELVIRSSIIERPEYEKLKQALEKYSRVDEKTLQKDPLFDEVTAHIIRTNFDAIVTNAVKEWEYFKHEHLKTRCTLDNRSLTTAYYIRNRINGKSIVVGSECITHFGVKSCYSNKPMSRIIEEAKREQAKIKRENIITQKFGNVRKHLYTFKNSFEYAPLLLPEAIYIACLRCYQQAEGFYNDFLNGIISEDSLNDFKAYLDMLDSKSKELEDWLESNANNNFIATVEDKKYLERTNKPEIIQQLRSNGSILTYNTIVALDYPGFLNRFLPTFQERLKNIFMKLELKNSQLYILLNHPLLSGIQYYCSIKEFLKIFGNALFESEPVNIPIKAYYCFLTCYNDDNNIIEVLNVFKDKFSPEYELLYDDKTQYFILITKNNNSYFNERINFSAISTNLLPKIAEGQSVHQIKQSYFRFIKWQSFNELEPSIRAEKLKRIKHLRKVYA